jgi:hypoxanthine phosphoribosyltransferase
MVEVRERMEWQEVGPAARALAERIVGDGYHPDVVLSIARGGLLVGGALAYALGVKNTLTLNVEFYAGVDERLATPVILPPVPDLSGLEGASVLIADDVADTGHTLALVTDFCRGKFADVRVAVLYEKPWTTVGGDYVWRRTDRWIDFPWSADAPVAVAA